MANAITAIAYLKNRQISLHERLKFIVSTAHIETPKTTLVQYVIYLLLLVSKKTRYLKMKLNFRIDTLQ